MIRRQQVFSILVSGLASLAGTLLAINGLADWSLALTGLGISLMVAWPVANEVLSAWLQPAHIILDRDDEPGKSQGIVRAD